MSRYRLMGWRVQPIGALDDGDTLTPVNVPPIEIAVGAWDAFKNGGDADAVAQLEAQAAEQPPAPKPNRAARRAKPKPA